MRTVTAGAFTAEYKRPFESDAFAPSCFSCAEFHNVNVQSVAVMAVLCFSLIAFIFRISAEGVVAVVSGIIILATLFLLIIINLRRIILQSRLYDRSER